VVAPQLEDVAVVSCELRTPPPRPIQWAADSPKTRTELNYQPGFGLVDLAVDAGPTSSPPVSTHQTVDNNVTRKRDSPLTSR
jgi:hypothetical protein